MKNSFLFIFAILLGLCSCSMDSLTDDSSEDINDPDAIKEYFKDWDITIPYQDVSESKTFQLLDALIEYIDKNQVSILFYPSSDIFYPSVTKFNEYIWKSKEAAALSEREDCALVLLSTYQKFLMTNRFKLVDDYWPVDNLWLRFFDYFLTSELCMSKLNLAEKVQLMVMALEKSKYGVLKIYESGSMTNTSILDYNIMNSIMLSSDYAPYINKAKPMLFEFASGSIYGLAKSDGTYLTGKEYNDFIAGYAKQFINDYK